jgi:hypothetical protein
LKRAGFPVVVFICEKHCLTQNRRHLIKVPPPSSFLKTDFLKNLIFIRAEGFNTFCPLLLDAAQAASLLAGEL